MRDSLNLKFNQDNWVLNKLLKKREEDYSDECLLIEGCMVADILTKKMSVCTTVPIQTTGATGRDICY